MSTASELSKATRGTKRVCAACDVRFYDLSRQPIVCPSCGAQFTPAAIAETGTRAAPYTSKTGWRSKGFKRPEPTPRMDDPEPIASPEIAVAEDATEETEAAAVVPDDDIVLEQEPEDAEVSDLVGRDIEDARE